ncbi:MAG TPA: DUF480 domain-containing protein [Verrucomicrobia bacterium]|nr:DUF480 domain-containing protein [Verrucomicrobiota bacterium]
MEILLKIEEVRALGSLIEKELTTPEYYPLSLNALVNACNQKSNRDPLTMYDERTVVRALEGLREKRLASMVTGAVSRVPKYRQLFTETVGMDLQDTAVLCELMLRGPQTAGELRNRAQRFCPIESIEQVEKIIEGLMAKENFSLIVKLPRQMGYKECRYAHLLSGTPEIREDQTHPAPEAARLEVQAENERMAKMESEIEAMKVELSDLKQQLLDFKKQFE